jgi:hypothetical protein
MLGAKVWQKPGALRPGEKVKADHRAGPTPQATAAADKLTKIP